MAAVRLLNVELAEQECRHVMNEHLLNDKTPARVDIGCNIYGFRNHAGKQTIRRRHGCEKVIETHYVLECMLQLHILT